MWARAEEREPTVEFGAGVLSSIGIASLDTPTPAAFTLPRSGNRALVEGMSGLALGAGIFVEARLRSRLGLQVGAAYSLETMSGDLDAGGETVEVVLEHPALTIPISLQGFLPLGSVTPFVAAGPELVIPIVPIAHTQPERAFPVAATAESHLRLSAATGVELRLPTEKVDLRVPLSLRASWYPAQGDDLEERVRVLPTDALIYTSTPRFGLRFGAGVGIYF